MLAKPRAARENGQETGNYMNDTQLAGYLADLRTSRVARLQGSRPAPSPKYGSQGRAGSTSNSMSFDYSYAGRPLVPEPLRLSVSPSEGKPIDASKVRGNLSTSPSVIYLEDGARAMERKESHSLRKALEDLDIQEEQRLYEAAQAEASKLVMEHRNPTVKSKESGYANPDLSQVRNSVVLREEPIVKDQLDSSCHTSREKNKSTRTVTFREPSPEAESLPATADTVPIAPIASRKKSYQGLANAVAADIANIKRRVSSGGKRIVSGGKRKASDKFSFPNPEDKIYEEPEPTLAAATVPTDSMQKPAQPEVISIADMPRHMRKNPFARVRFNKDSLERANSIASTSSTSSVKFNPVEIQKNPPTQSRKPWYMSNSPAPPPAVASEVAYPDMENPTQLKQEQELEIRGDDIRAATSVRRKDRNPNLPQPTAVSDSPGRPIVSFQNQWKSSEPAREQARTSSRDEPTSEPPAASDVPASSAMNSTKDIIAAARRRAELAISRGVVREPIKQRPADLTNRIPILNLPGDDDGTWSKTLSEDPSVPQINILQCEVEPEAAPPALVSIPQSRPTGYTHHDKNSKSRSLPRPKASQPQRSDTQRSARSSTSNSSHITTVPKRSAALCAHCALPISGRILTAAGERFHPDCFTCHQCGINLECVAFYPEPDQKYYERIARIQQRMQGFEVAVPEGANEEDIRRLEQADGDESMRFFCHLDFHELFSPRCRSCKTPIEGEVVVACGAEWHVGHFFCAQCGDPFDSNTPFVEKDGYAWCLGCHTNRYSPKCKMCRKPVTDVVVSALGFDWHVECFCCVECGGEFDDGQYFLRGDSTDPVCIRCEDRRLKA